MHKLTEHITEALSALPACKRVWVAFSGGVDSTVLLHCLIPLRERWDIGVLHVNHQLSPRANDWQEHCKKICQQFGFKHFVSERVEIKGDGQSLEQAARRERYAVFERYMETGDALLMGHHQQDQAETFLLRLVRGAGARGLSAMAPVRVFTQGWLVRPFLAVDKAELIAYAQAHLLSWVDDESNASERFDRNYLRAKVLPLLHQRWPQFSRQVSKATELLRENEQLLREYIAGDFSLLGSRSERVGQSICLTSLTRLPLQKQYACIRYWLDQLGYRAPSLVQMQEIQTVMAAQADRSPLLEWQDCEIRRFQQRLFCLPKNWQAGLENYSISLAKWLENKSQKNEISLFLKEKSPLLNAKSDFVEQIKIIPLAKYSGSRRAKPSGRQHSQSIKKLMQEHQVEAWLRPYWPVLVHNSQMVCALDLWVESDFTEQCSFAFTLSWKRN